MNYNNEQNENFNKLDPNSSEKIIRVVENQQQQMKDSKLTSNKPTDGIDETSTIYCEEFDDILKIIGSDGKYQKCLHYGFILPYMALVSFFFLNAVFMLYEPDHWCHVPGKDTGMSKESWKNLTIPKDSTMRDGGKQLGQCYMYENTNGNISTKPIECQYGWEYDRTDYTETIPSQYDWVCTKSHFATTAFTAYYIGSFVGACVLGGLGDKIGRKLVFLIANFMCIFFRGISLFIVKYFYLFLLMQFLIGTSNPMMYIAPLTTLTEICSNDYRSWIFATVWSIWVIGLSLLPIIAWLSGNWFTFGIITTLPGLFIFIFYKYLPESPRWLLSVGRLIEAGEILKKIAHVNGTFKNLKNEQIEKMLKELQKKQQKTGIKTTTQIWDLFRHKCVGKNIIFLCITWCVNKLVYYGIILNTTSMAGNQFVNFFLLSIIELPTGAMGRLAVEKIGRRWSHVIGLFLCTITFFLAGIGVLYNGMEFLVLSSIIIAKMSVSITSLIAHLQINEIFPTQLRSTANGFIAFVGSFVVICTPVLVYLNKFHSAVPYIALGIMSWIGVIASSFLPETLNQSLPETIEDVNERDKHTKFWSFLPKDYKRSNKSSFESMNKP